MPKYTEKEAIEKINNKIKYLKENNNQDISFLGFEGHYTNAKETKIKLYDNIYNESGVITCKAFLDRGWSCKSFRYSKSASSNRKYTIESFERIAKEHVEKMNSWSNSNLSFLGIVNNGELAANRIQLIIKCNKHNEICYPTFSKFIMKDHYCCPQCRILYPNFTSAGEEKCYQELCKYIDKDKIERQHRIDNSYQNIFGCTKKYFLLDIYCEENKLLIEYDGIAHFEYKEHFYRKGGYQDFINQVNRDKTLEYYCKINNIKLLRVSYLDDSRIEEVIRAFIIEGKDITTHIQPKLLPALIYD